MGTKLVYGYLISRHSLEIVLMSVESRSGSLLLKIENDFLLGTTSSLLPIESKICVWVHYIKTKLCIAVLVSGVKGQGHCYLKQSFL